MATTTLLKDTFKYTIIVLISFVILQAIVVLMHEFTHSTTAWLLGCMENPLDIVWGNPLMMTGWDEGVHYHKLFPAAGNIKETLIGGSPLLIHTIITSLGIVLLQQKWLQAKKWVFHIIYWFVVANLMELIAYIIMRPFAVGGDTGHFNRGLNLSPWFLFIIGSIAIIYGLFVIYRKILPVMFSLFAPSNIITQWVILVLTSFLLFIWGSGLRIVMYIYPDEGWLFGLIGFVAFIVGIIIYKPSKKDCNMKSHSTAGTDLR